MSSRNELLTLATSTDSEEILDLLESSPFEGRVSLLYTRRPDAWASLMKEGDDVKVVAAREPETGRIGGMGVCALRRAYVNGRVARIGYLLGLRSRDGYFNRYRVLPRSYAYLRESCGDVDYFITSILEDNSAARSLLEKDRPFMPRYDFIGRYDVFALRTRRAGVAHNGLTLRRATTDDAGAINDLLAGAGARRQFFPVIEPGKDVPLSEFRVLTGGGREVVGVCSLWDQSDYKQYIVEGYRGVMRLLPALNPVARWLRLPPAPPAGSTLRFFTLSYAVVKDDDPGLYANLLALVAGESDYPFFLAGVYERDPMWSVVARAKHIRYTSRIYLVDWERTDEAIRRLDPDFIPYFECGQL